MRSLVANQAEAPWLVQVIGTLERRFGLVPSAQQRDVLRVAVPEVMHMRGVSSPHTYCELLSALPLEHGLVQHLMRTLSVDDSYFFRDRSAMQTLRERVLPEVIERASATRILRIWSAGCSSGEELYTIAALLHELLPDRSGWTIRLLGTDVDCAAIKRARAGVYETWSLRMTTDQERERLFERVPGGYRVRDELRQDISFGHHNLADVGGPLPLPLAFDLIVCRDVASAFGREAFVSLRRNLERALCAGGLWVAAPKDPMPGLPFKTQVHPGLVVHSLARAHVAPAQLDGSQPDEVTRRVHLRSALRPRMAAQAPDDVAERDD